ncbi:MAG: phosphoribosylanthranilate isomerase [Planctomycetota bacterium]
MSQRTRIKVCGVKDVAAALAAADAGADFVGLVFVRASPRFIPPEAAREIVAALPIGVEPIGLFCDHTVDDVRDAAATAGLRTVQLHGREGPGFAKQLGGLRIIKAIGFEPGKLAERLQPWREARTGLAAVLLDTPPKADAAITGGGGEPFDWDALADAESTGHFRGLPPRFLAGGLTPRNVAAAIEKVRPYAVDVSSGVESSRGVKDPAMIAHFCAAVRDADRADKSARYPLSDA